MLRGTFCLTEFFFVEVGVFEIDRGHIFCCVFFCLIEGDLFLLGGFFNLMVELFFFEVGFSGFRVQLFFVDG